jgi:hypothetical protein
MDKLEHYLDQVCRGIGGARSLRQHLRQELREHLLDAVAEHRRAGLSEEAALEQALEDFGGSEQVHSELEATHGHRFLAVMIDKAMQWKEMTMRAKWLWMTWAYLAVGGVFLMELLYLGFAAKFLLPKMQKLKVDGMFAFDDRSEPMVAWMDSFLHRVEWAWQTLSVMLFLLLAVLWGLFEWRVRSENKPFMRLAALGTAALGLMLVVVLTAGSQEVPFYVGLPAMGQISAPFASEQMASIDRSVSAIEQALPKKDWEAIQDQANRASGAVNRLGVAAGGISALKALEGKPTATELRARLKSANEWLLEAQQAGREKDAERLTAALQKFHDLYGPIEKAARKPPK